MWGQGTFFGLSGAVLAAAAALVYYLTSTITSTLRRLGERMAELSSLKLDVQEPIRIPRVVQATPTFPRARRPTFARASREDTPLSRIRSHQSRRLAPAFETPHPCRDRPFGKPQGRPCNADFAAPFLWPSRQGRSQHGKPQRSPRTVGTYARSQAQPAAVYLLLPPPHL